ncbi:MAG: hypothetical protein NT096_01610 [Proteobacteria bacterium]|nr:hypothetical protein [Pseudomonadota bacterium]
MGTIKSDEMTEKDMDVPEMLEELINDRGFKLPLFFVCISTNGRMTYGRYDASRVSDELIDTVLCEYMPEKEFVLPANLLIVDSSGESARIVLSTVPPSFH